jgi:acyl-coenzyme A synthetase/AMP-(fatty) acid ligase
MELAEDRGADVVIETAMIGMPEQARDEIFVVPKTGANITEEEVM